MIQDTLLPLLRVADVSTDSDEEAFYIVLDGLLSTAS